MKMKKFIFLFLALFISYNAYSETENCYVHVQIDPDEEPPGTLMWDDINLCCVDGGCDCILVPCDYYCQGELMVVTSGFTLTLHLDNVMIYRKINNNWTVYTRSGNNYPFDRSHHIIISNCPSYPELNNLRIELDGLYTNSQGYYNVFIPSGSY